MTDTPKRPRGRPRKDASQTPVAAPSTARPVKQWVGASPLSMPPLRVRLRIFQAHGGICGLTERLITPQDKWDLDHTIALANGGTNDEANLRPVLRDAHKIKTAADVAEKAKVAAVAKKHLGIKSDKKSPLAGRTQEEKNAAKAPPSGRLGLPARVRDIFGNPI